MKPMKPMEPMTPMESGPDWWPKHLGQPSTSGGQNDLRYAFFAQRHRLVIRQNGRDSLYDTADHHISGVSQDGAGAPVFTSQHGTLDLGELKKAD